MDLLETVSRPLRIFNELKDKPQYYILINGKKYVIEVPKSILIIPDIKKRINAIHKLVIKKLALLRSKNPSSYKNAISTNILSSRNLRPVKKNSILSRSNPSLRTKRSRYRFIESLSEDSRQLLFSKIINNVPLSDQEKIEFKKIPASELLVSLQKKRDLDEKKDLERVKDAEKKLVELKLIASQSEKKVLETEKKRLEAEKKLSDIANQKSETNRNKQLSTRITKIFNKNVSDNARKASLDTLKEVLDPAIVDKFVDKYKNRLVDEKSRYDKKEKKKILISKSPEDTPRDSADTETKDTQTEMAADIIDSKITGTGLSTSWRNADQKGPLPALYDDQIEEYFSSQPMFSGVISSDQIDELPLFLPQGFIMNLSKLGEDGTHWVAVFLTPGSVEYFDPLANPPDKSFLKDIKTKIIEMRLPHMLKLKINKIKQQNANSYHCGYHSIRFLDDRFHHIPFPLSTRYTEESGKILENSKAGEKALKNQFDFI